jgi:hypothetical protein
VLKTSELGVAKRLQFLSDVGGTRAEDPFRGLRAGPVPFSPIAFPAVRPD